MNSSLREIVREVTSQRLCNDKWIKQFLRSHGVKDAIDRLKTRFDDLRLNVLVRKPIVIDGYLKP